METEIRNDTPNVDETLIQASPDARTRDADAEIAPVPTTVPLPTDAKQLHKKRIDELVDHALQLPDPDEALHKSMKAGLYELEAELASESKEKQAETGQLDPRLVNTRLRTARLVREITRAEQQEIAGKRKAKIMHLNWLQLAKEDPLLRNTVS